LIETREESLPDHLQALRVKKESERLKRKRSASTFVLLDTTGKMMSSEEISQWLANVSGDVDFLMGGSSGFQISGETLRLSLAIHSRMNLPRCFAGTNLLRPDDPQAAPI
jgi:23S rRNA pseudoU1915 N3-methylase RlmH